MIVRVPGRSRQGFTLTVVLIFVILLFAIWSAVSRTSSSLLRIETNRVLQQSRDQGAMNTLAQAVQLLQYSHPADATNPNRTQFTYGVQAQVVDASGSCTTSDYTVVFTARPDLAASRWQIQVSPGYYSVALPAIGASPQWP
jgi:hypothetical protein